MCRSCSAERVSWPALPVRLAGFSSASIWKTLCVPSILAKDSTHASALDWSELDGKCHVDHPLSNFVVCYCVRREYIE